ncbi:GNAT family N-acetyltransferase [Aneurinibacillus migulanus]|uniref:GNAT family N-acetyltransferase n=1 Tax=Aneurinibacillus migulanus TaxID=47500 RepID=UPI003B970CFA
MEFDLKVQRIIDKQELEAAFYIRKIVFVEEQKVPLEDEFDEHDAYADHVLVYYDEKPVGTGRLRIVDNAAKLERICILASHRKYGLGKEIVKSLERIAKERGLSKVKLHGQTHAEHFYKKLGYQTASEIFIEDGIPHILMVKDISEHL